MKERDYIVWATLALIVASTGCIITVAFLADTMIGFAVAAALFGYGAYCCASTLKNNPEK